MSTDVGTVIWKEWKEILLQGGKLGRWNLVVFVVAFGIVMPWQFGREWVTSPISLIYWGWVPPFMVITVIADSFAGERERHTLETLLASRLSDRAILLGKMGAALSYGWGLTMISTILGLITVNVVHRTGTLLLYAPVIACGIVLISLLTAAFAAGIGIVISLRSATVRQAQQTLSLVVMGIMFLPTFGVQALPLEYRKWIAESLAHIGTANGILGISALLLIVDATLFRVAAARFQRTRLILD